MFNSKNSNNNASSLVANHINDNTNINGDIQANSDMRIDGNVKGNSVLRMCKIGPNAVIEDSVRIVTDVNNYFHTGPVTASKKGGPAADQFDLKDMKIPQTKGKKW